MQKIYKRIIMERDIKNIKDQVGLIWLTIIGYIIYLEFFKG